MDEQLIELRKLAANKYNKDKNIIKEKRVDYFNNIPRLSYIFIKEDKYYININNEYIKLEDNCHLKLYDKPRSLSEFGKSFNIAYVKTVTGVTYIINEKTFLLPFAEIKHYRD